MAKWCVKAGKSKSAKTVRCFKTKGKAKKAAAARRKSGKKARIAKCGC